jgi:hypothetical protein
MKKNKQKNIEANDYEKGTGNVFADLRFEYPESVESCKDGINALRPLRFNCTPLLNHYLHHLFLYC